jgi:hypothetical protein
MHLISCFIFNAVFERYTTPVYPNIIEAATSTFPPAASRSWIAWSRVTPNDVSCLSALLRIVEDSLHSRYVLLEMSVLLASAR